MAIPLLAAAGVGAGLGLAKNIYGAHQAKAERERQAQITRYSPWTGMHGQSVKDPNPFGDIMQGAASGVMMGASANALGNGSGVTEFTGADTTAMGSGMPQYSLLEGTSNTSPYSLMGDQDLMPGNSAWMSMPYKSTFGS